jgi:nitroimidazol reductase NimA-like FMN-containing flavoprotein (pyridoxamine 5'-phosphate oxidase superfamily)
MADRVNEELDEAESLRLISAGGVGRIAYMSRFGPAVLPVNYKWHGGAVAQRTLRPPRGTLGLLKHRSAPPARP